MNLFESFWQLGYRRLVPIIPPDAEVSKNSTLFKRLNTPQDSRGKAPGVKGQYGWHGFDWLPYEADEHDLKRWHDMGAGVGIKTGDGLIAIDADTLDQDLAQIILAELTTFTGPIPTRIGRSPKALYLARSSEPIKYQRIEFNGNERLEILSDGRQFVAHGTHPKTLKPYYWPIKPIPYDALPVVSQADLDKLFSILKGKLPAASSKITEGGTSSINQDALKGDAEHVRKAVAAIENTSENFPSRETYRDMGYAIKAALPDDENEALHIFKEWCARWKDGYNDPDIVEADWQRMKPPFRRGASWLYEMAGAIGDGSFNSVDVWFDEVIEAELEPENPFEAAAAREAKEDREQIVPLTARPISTDDLKDIPPRQWVYGNKALRKYVTFIASPSGVGKTAWTFAAGLSCASGKQLLHDEPRGGKPLKVWLFNLEDDIDELRRRLIAAWRYYDLDEDVLSRVWLNSGRDRGLRIVRTDSKDGFVVMPDRDLLVAEIRRLGIDIVFVDPFLRTHRVPENDSDAQDEVLRLFAQVAEETGCAIFLVHHTRKGAVAGDADSMRGSSAQGGGARGIFTLSAMSPEEAAKLGVPEGERRLYVRIDDAKKSMAPPAAKSEWMRLASYGLGNGTDDYPGGDHVQVASAWAPPDAWEGVGAESEAAVLARIEAGLADGERYSVRGQDKGRWVGELLVSEMNRTPAQAKDIIEGWLKIGVIEVREYKSETQRKKRQGIFVVGQASSDIFS